MTTRTRSVKTGTDLERFTKRFMAGHWNQDVLKAAAPEWIVLDPLNVTDEAEEGGCYAVFDLEGRLVYVGLALAEHDPAHPKRKAGLLRRLFRHVIRRGALAKGVLEVKREAWNENGGISRIMILPFPSTCAYLAAGLEVYLIQELGSGLVMNKSRVRKELADAA
jgi:hypothetical protein